jgi:hypothetical protein
MNSKLIAVAFLIYVSSGELPAQPRLISKRPYS